MLARNVSQSEFITWAGFDGGIKRQNAFSDYRGSPRLLLSPADGGDAIFLTITRDCKLYFS